MNNSWCRAHKKTLYELIYGDKPRGSCTLIEDLYEKNIYNEEEIPDNIQIVDNYIENLDDGIIFGQGIINFIIKLLFLLLFIIKFYYLILFYFF